MRPVEEATASFDERVRLFVDAACGGDLSRAQSLLERDPSIASANLATACVVADRERAEERIARDPKIAGARCGPRGWEPLLYLCHSRWSTDETKLADRLAIGTRLLAAGADPNAFYLHDPDDPKSRISALVGAVGHSDCAPLAKLLLEAGADPNDNESVYHAAEGMHGACLELLLERGLDVDASGNPHGNTPLYFLMGYLASHEQTPRADEGIRWLLEHGADPNRPSGALRETPLHRAVVSRGPDMLELLVSRGADPTARRADGRTPHELAVLHGNADAAAWLAGRGFDGGLTPADALLAACASEDVEAARRFLAEEPEIVSTLSREQRAALPSLARQGRAAAVRLMLDLGFPIDATGEDGETALHAAAWTGERECVEVLLAHGAPTDPCCTAFGSPPLGWAAHGSRWCRNPAGDYAGVVAALVTAGADVHAPGNRPGAKLTEMASDVIAEELRRHGAED